MKSWPQVAGRTIDDLARVGIAFGGPPMWGPPSGGPFTSNNKFERSLNGETGGSKAGAGVLERICASAPSQRGDMSEDDDQRR